MELDKLIKEYLNVCLYQNNLNNKTIKAYRLDLEQFSKFNIGKNEFTKKEVILDYIYFLNKNNYKTKTVKRKIASLKAFFSYLNYEEKIKTSPFSKIRLKIKEPIILPKIIPLEQLNILFQYIYNEKNKSSITSYTYKAIVRDIAVVELLFGTGVRISELCSLKQDDIAIQNHTIKIFGKGAKERIIPIYNKNILDALENYQKIFCKEILSSEYFFVNKRKNQLSSQSVRNMIKKHSIASNISIHITPHMFRHTFATTLLEVDVDSRHIQQILGHSSITTTQIYTHLTSNKKSEIMKLKNPRSKIIINEG